MYNLYAIFAKYPLKFISKGTHFVRDTRKRIKFALILRLPCEIKNKALPLHQQIPPASRKISVPSGTFLFMGVRYTHQAITTEQQIDILRERGLLIDNVEQAIEILDNIS